MTRYERRLIDPREQLRCWVDPRLGAVRVADLQAYLLRQKWKPVPADRPHALVFEEPEVSDGGPLYQFVPASEQLADYHQRVFELVSALAVIEGRYAGDVLDEILRPGAGQANGAGVPQEAPATSR